MDFPFGMAYFQVQTVSFGECHRGSMNWKKWWCRSTTFWKTWAMRPVWPQTRKRGCGNDVKRSSTWRSGMGNWAIWAWMMDAPEFLFIFIEKISQNSHSIFPSYGMYSNFTLSEHPKYEFIRHFLQRITCFQAQMFRPSRDAANDIKWLLHGERDRDNELLLAWCIAASFTAGLVEVWVEGCNFQYFDL